MSYQKKKILIFTDCMIFGGSEKVLTNIINSPLIQEYYEMKYSYRNHKEYREQLLKSISNHIAIPLPLLSNESFFYKLSFKKKSFALTLTKVFLKILDYSHIYYLLNFFVLFWVFKKNNPDILFVNNGGYPGAKNCRLAPIVAKLAGIKKVLFNVNNLAFQPKFIIEGLYDRIINKQVDFYITASKAASLQLAEARMFPIKKMIVISNSTKLEENTATNVLRSEFKLEKNKIVVGSVGLLTKRKGFDVLIEAFKILNNRDILLFIFGEGEERENLEALISESNLQNNIFLPGYKNNIIAYMNDFDIFVLPSKSNEDMPYVIIEAMMLKKPVIGTKVAGIPEEITHGETGFVVEANNPAQLADRINFFLNNNDTIVQFGKNGFRKYSELFSYDIVMKKYLELFNSVLEIKQ